MVVIIATGMHEPDSPEEIGMEHAPTIEEALETSLNQHGRDSTVTVIPYASITYAGLQPKR